MGNNFPIFYKFLGMKYSDFQEFMTGYINSRLTGGTENYGWDIIMLKKDLKTTSYSSNTYRLVIYNKIDNSIFLESTKPQESYRKDRFSGAQYGVLIGSLEVV